MDGPAIGSAVLFTDSVGHDHLALVTNTFGTTINLVYASEDVSRTDTYGRQLERATSVQHQGVAIHAPGMFWRGVTEEKREAAYPQGSAQLERAAAGG